MKLDDMPFDEMVQNIQVLVDITPIIQFSKGEQELTWSPHSVHGFKPG